MKLFFVLILYVITALFAAFFEVASDGTNALVKLEKKKISDYTISEAK